MLYHMCMVSLAYDSVYIYNKEHITTAIKSTKVFNLA